MFTLGPWKQEADSHFIVSANELAKRFVCVALESTLETTQSPVYVSKDKELQGNINLIVAAPNLLNALRECITDYGAYCYRSPSIAGLKIRLSAINEIAQAAIDDVEGK